MTGRCEAFGRRVRERADGDGGFTLLEIVVVMTIMLIVMVVFTAGITQAYSAEDRVESASNAESQITIAFQRLDKEVRYASAVSNQGLVGTDTYVEWLTTNTGTPVCTELRLHTSNGQLQQRSWTQGMTPLVPGAWVPLASGITATPSTTTPATPTPFNVIQATSTFNFQRLQLELTATAGGGSTSTAKGTNITFTALNTSLNTASSTTCTEGRAVA
jgi:prepilin-type N-terminal cleavage/methylation domain-containing protein